MLHEVAPLYRFVLGRLSQAPLHNSTASLGADSAGSLPRITATAFMVSLPPTGQRRVLRSPLTQASAKLRQPGYPHPPQLAPGRLCSTWSIQGSSYTANRFDTMKRMAARANPMVPKIKMADKVVVISYKVSWLVGGTQLVDRQGSGLETEGAGQLPFERYQQTIIDNRHQQSQKGSHSFVAGKQQGQTQYQTTYQ